MIRILDILLSIVLIVLTLPITIVSAICIVIDDPGPIFFRQERVGKAGRKFRLLKFRTMRVGAEIQGQLTIGKNDSRITRIGNVLRSYKLDEIPQLFQVLSGVMSMVGPRPEVPKYVARYTESQRQILKVRPGMTDFASVAYYAENELLAKSSDPDATYINEIMPAKIELNMRFINQPTVANYFLVLWMTFKRMISS